MNRPIFTWNLEMAMRRFWLEPVSLANSTGFNSTELNKLRKLIVEKRSDFIINWNEHFNSE